MGQVSASDSSFWRRAAGKPVNVRFRDGVLVKGTAEMMDEDLGSAGVSWEDGPRRHSCRFSVEQVESAWVVPG
jgi:hypothetical protein